MSLLDDECKNDGKFTPKPRRYRSPHDFQSDEERLGELNNLGRGEVTEDFSDSPHADRV